MCAYTWTDYQPWRALPITPQQRQWLDARGLSCDGMRGEAADMIGDRVPWRKAPPTEAQAAWFSEHELFLPHSRGVAADMMWHWAKRMRQS